VKKNRDRLPSLAPRLVPRGGENLRCPDPTGQYLSWCFFEDSSPDQRNTLILLDEEPEDFSAILATRDGAGGKSGSLGADRRTEMRSRGAAGLVFPWSAGVWGWAEWL